MGDEQRKPLEYYSRLHDHRGFVRVRRGSGEIERGWALLRTDTAPYGCVIVYRPRPGSVDEWQNKRVELAELFKLNPELMPPEERG